MAFTPRAQPSFHARPGREDGCGWAAVEVPTSGHAAACELMATLEAVGMPAPQAMAQVLALYGPDAAKAAWDRFLVGAGTSTAAVEVLDAVGDMAPETANAWLTDALLTQKMPYRREAQGLPLPDGLYLAVRSWLTDLPSHIQIPGMLSVMGCDRLTCLPEGLTVRGELSAQQCHALVRVGQDINIHGACDLQHCNRLAQLPRGLRVDGNLLLSGSKALGSLPPDLRVEGCLETVGCPALHGRVPADAAILGGVMEQCLDD